MLYLTKTIKASALSKHVKVCVSKMNPILIQYTFPKDTGCLEYFVAPVIHSME